MNILLIQHRTEATDKYIFALESRYGATTTTVSDLAEAENAIKAGQDVDLIVIDGVCAGSGDIAVLSGLTPKAGVVLISEGGRTNPTSPNWNCVGIVNAANLISGTFAAIDKWLPTSPIPSSTEDAGVYCRIRTKILLDVAPLRGDIFIRLTSQKFVKLFREGDTFDHGDMSRYAEQKKIEYLYIQTDQCGLFIEKYRQDLEKKLAPGVALSLAEAAAIQNSVHETAQEMGRRIGFTKDVQVLAKTQIQIAVKTLKNSKNLSTLLETIERNPASYIASHSTLTGFISSAIASQLEWGSDATMYKLNLAAFLHDITLDGQEIAKCATLAEAESGDYKATEKEQFKLHPVKAAEIAREFSEVPPDVDAIILQHHERPDSSGFPRGISHSHISPLSAVFIVAHDMADAILKSTEPFQMSRFADEVTRKYPGGGFRKVAAVLKELRIDPPKSEKAA